MKFVIDGSQRGIVFKNGVFWKVLSPGQHSLRSKKYTLERVSIAEPFELPGFPMEQLLQDENLAEELMIKNVADEMLALHFIDGRYHDCLTSGQYCYWKDYGEHTFFDVDMKITEVDQDFPRYLFAYLPKELYLKLEVEDFQRARLYYDKKFVRLLEEGTYYFWNNGVKVEAQYVDTRLLKLYITGQEIMTLDKVGLRINFVCQYRITDYIKSGTEIEDLPEQIHIQAQLALREYIGRYKLDEILANKDKVSSHVLNRLKEKEGDYYISFYDAGVRDFILPGEIREIMNTVLIAEKKAQANVISRREEVASTRSLLNTAKLMDENKTLYQLKELEYLERICENVGTISLNGGTDLLSQLGTVLTRKEKEHYSKEENGKKH